MDNDVDDKQFDSLMTYANDHVQVAIENTGRQAARMIAEIKATADPSAAMMLPGMPGVNNPVSVPGGEQPSLPVQPEQTAPDPSVVPGMPGFGNSVGQQASKALSQ